MNPNNNDILKKGLIKLFIVVFPCLVLSAYLGHRIPILLKELSLNFNIVSEFNDVLKSLVLIILFTYFNRAIYQLVVNKYVKILVQNLRLACFNKWVHAYEVDGDNTQKNHYPQGEVITRILNDTESIRELITSGTFGILIDAFFVLSCLVSFISINSTLGWALTFVEILVVFLLIKGSKIMRVVFLEVSHSRGRVSRTMANLVAGLRESYFTPHFDYASKKGNYVFDDFLSIQLKANMWDAIYYSIAESLYPILLAFMVLIFPYSHITEGAIIFVIIDLIQRSISPIKDIAGKISNVQRAMAGAIRINEFSNDLEKLPSSEGFSGLSIEEDLHEDMYSLDKFESLEIDIDEFSYPLRQGANNFSLKNIKIKAHASEFYGIVGTSGCGKSTLFNIMAAKIYPTHGKISMCFKNNEKIIFPSDNPSTWRRYRQMIGLVGQDSHIFSDTIGFNITLGREVELGKVDLFFQELQVGIPYLIEWGITLGTTVKPEGLSVGQKQLLAAIRALYWKRPVILFDEIASALDSNLELALRHVIRIIQKESLVFIVAHRIETLLNADTIIAMNNGKIEAMGKHAELMTQSEYYQKFIQELMHSLES